MNVGNNQPTHTFELQYFHYYQNTGTYMTLNYKNLFDKINLLQKNLKQYNKKFKTSIKTRMHIAFRLLDSILSNSVRSCILFIQLRALKAIDRPRNSDTALCDNKAKCKVSRRLPVINDASYLPSPLQIKFHPRPDSNPPLLIGLPWVYWGQ